MEPRAARAFPIRSSAGFSLRARSAGRAVSVHVHVEHARLVAQKVIVKGRDLEPVVEQGGHHGIDLVFGQDEIAHQDIHAASALRHRDPAAESEWCGRVDAGNGDVQIVARNVHFEHVRFVVALFAERAQHLLVFGGYFLRANAGCERQRQQHARGRNTSKHEFPPNAKTRSINLPLRR